MGRTVRPRSKALRNGSGDHQEPVWFPAAAPERNVSDDVFIESGSPDGFDILVERRRAGVLVSFGGLTQRFDDTSEAFDWVRRALSRDYQLRVDYVGGKPYRWTLEFAVDGSPPVPVMSTWQFALLLPLRTRRQVTYRNVD